MIDDQICPAFYFEGNGYCIALKLTILVETRGSYQLVGGGSKDGRKGHPLAYR